MDNSIITWVVEFILAGITGVLGFFLRRTINELDKKASVCELARVEKTSEEQRLDIKSLNDKYATKAELTEIKQSMSKMQDDIQYVRDNAIKKEDFYRSMADLQESVKNINDFIMRK